MKMARINVRAKKSNGDRALTLIGLVLDRDYLIDCLEKLPYVLARAPAMDELRRTNSALKVLRAVNEEASEPDQRCRQFPCASPDPKGAPPGTQVFKIIGGVIGDLRSRRNTSVPGMRRTVTRVSFSDFVRADFGQLCLCHVLRQQVDLSPSSLSRFCATRYASPLAS